MSRDHEAADPTFDAEAFRRGDPECFRLLLRRFGPLIRSIVASYAQDGDDRDELYQTISIRLLTQRGHYEDRGAMRGWITRLAHNCCRNWFAARKAHGSAHDRYIARATLSARHSDRPASWRRLAVTGALVGAMIFLLLLLPSDVAGSVQVPHAALFGLAGGVAAALFFRKRDEKECGVVRRDQTADGSSRKGA